MVVRRILTGALLAPLLTVSACGGGDSSVAAPPISPEPSTSSPTQAPERESPQHFIRRWFDSGTRMQNTGKTSAYRSLQDGCSDCVAVASRVEKAYAAGGYFKTGGVRELHVIDIKGSENHPTVDVKVKLAPTIYLEERGAEPKHFTGGVAYFQIGLELSDEDWLVTRFVQVAT